MASTPRRRFTRPGVACPAATASCDNCYGVCPDNAVLKLSEAADANVNGYEIDLDYCKGCGICVSECPCGAIRMEPETI